MNVYQRCIKRVFDIGIASVGLILTWPIIIFAYILASIDTRSNGFFTQKRIGKEAKAFSVIKIKTMRPHALFTTTVTSSADPRITATGKFFRLTKIDELPQLINVLLGDMSMVGPRPDVPGYADQLQGEDKIILSVRPGITGPASLKYKDEETLLAQQEDPKRYNDEIIWPDKVCINRQYILEWSFSKDLYYLWRTFTS